MGTRDKKILGKNKKKVDVSKLSVKCQLTAKTTEVELKEIKDTRTDFLLIEYLQPKGYIGFELLVGGKSLHKLHTETNQERDAWLKELKSAKNIEEAKIELSVCVVNLYNP